MLKQPVPNVTGMTDTLEFIKNLWGSMNVPGANLPGMAGPSLSTDELDKKIGDLKAVEAWLTLNMSMLRGTIQALEVQRGTIATLKSMSASMAQAMGQPAAEGMPAAASPFQSFFPPPGDASAPPAAGQPGAAPLPAEGAPAAGAGFPPGAAAMMPAAVAWWNLLQDQFTQAVASTMSPEAMANAAAMAQDAAARFGAPTADAPVPAAPDAEPSNASAQPGVTRPRNGKPKTDKS
jgi:hypothetical protein